jgi:hypothetical protein
MDLENALAMQRVIFHQKAQTFSGIMNIRKNTKDTITVISAQCKPAQKPHANLSDTPVYLTSASKCFQMLPKPPGAKQNALRLCKRIPMCS